MFGYVIPNQAALSPEAQARYRAAYCESLMHVQVHWLYPWL